MGLRADLPLSGSQVHDRARDWAALEHDRNPFAVVVMAHLKAREVRDGAERAYSTEFCHQFRRKVGSWSFLVNIEEVS